MEITKDYLINKGFNPESKFEFVKKIVTQKDDLFFGEILTKTLELYIILERNTITVSIDSTSDEGGDLDCVNIKLHHIQTQKQLEDLYLILSNNPL